MGHEAAVGEPGDVDAGRIDRIARERIGEDRVDVRDVVDREALKIAARIARVPEAPSVRIERPIGEREKETVLVGERVRAESGCDRDVVLRVTVEEHEQGRRLLVLERSVHGVGARLDER